MLCFYYTKIDINKLLGTNNLDQFVEQMSLINEDDIIIGSIEKTLINKKLFIDQNSSDIDKPDQVEISDEIIVKEINRSINQHVEDLLLGAFRSQDLNSLSLIPYESSFASGKMCVIYGEGTKIPKMQVKISESEGQLESISLKQIRKFLQVSQNDLVLVIHKDIKEQTYAVLGYAQSKDIDKTPIVEINGQMQWQITLGQKTLLCCKNGKYQIPIKQSYSNVVLELRKVFGSVETESIRLVITEIVNKKCGAILIFLSEKVDVTHLWKNQRGFPVDNPKPSECLKFSTSPVSSFSKILTSLCQIDGALVFNKQGELIAFGTILDGVATCLGDRSRGSRYNSTKTFVNYYQSKIENECNTNDIEVCAIVISEDGYVDFVKPEPKKK